MAPRLESIATSLEISRTGLFELVLTVQVGKRVAELKKYVFE